MISVPKIINFPEALSSNTMAMNLAQHEKLKEGTIINVLNQTQGKGQGKHSWHSLASQNLTFSMILYPEFLSFSNQFYLSKTVAVAVAEFVNTFIEDVFIKWPNDIYIKDKKTAGILIENNINGNKMNISIIGIGININQTLFPKEILNPTSIAIETHKEYNTKFLLIKLQKHILKWYLYLKNAEYEKINKAYHKQLFGKNETCHFSKDDQLFKAKILNVDTQGLLHIDINGEEKKYAVGEIILKGKKTH